MEHLLPSLNEFLKERGIESIGLIRFSDCTVINRPLLERSMEAPKTVIMMLIPYFTADSPERNLSLYAVPRDYHLFTASLGRQVTSFLSERYPDHRFAFFADHSPIDERGAAAACGLGVIGDNGLIIHPRWGSYVFLSEIITDLALPCVPDPAPARGCLHCGRCKKACPSPTYCLSAITQKKGELTDGEIALMRKCRTAWGCDVCQTVCPMNGKIEPTPIPFFYEERIFRLTPQILGEMDKEAFSSRAFAWRGRATIGRNLSFFFDSED